MQSMNEQTKQWFLDQRPLARAIGRSLLITISEFFRKPYRLGEK